MPTHLNSLAHLTRTGAIVALAGLLIIGTGAMSASAATPPVWTPPVTISTVGTDANNPLVAIAPNGTVTTVWRGTLGGADSIYTSTSTDRGLTWTTPVGIVASATENPAALVAAPDNGLTLITSSSSGGSLVGSRHSTDGGVTWSALVAHTFGAEQSYSPRLAVAPDGTLLLAWGSYNGSASLLAVSTSADGLIWTPAVGLSARGSSGHEIAVLPAGQFSAIWRADLGGTYVINTRISTDSGATWAAATAIAPAASTAINPAIVGSADGRITAAWTAVAGGYGTTFTSFSTDGGSSWSTATNLANGGNDSNSPQVAATPDNGLIIIWENYDGFGGTRVQAARSSDGGVTWVPSPYYLSMTATNANAVQMLVSPDGTITLAWHLFNFSNTVIQSLSSTDGGATWDFAQVSGDGYDSYSPRLAVAGDNTIVTVWRRGGGSPTSTESSTTAPLPAAPAALAATGMDAAPLAAGALALALLGFVLVRRRASAH